MGNTALAQGYPAGAQQQAVVVHIINPEGTFTKNVHLGEIRGNEIYLMDPEPAHLAQNSWLQLTFHPDAGQYATVVRGVVSYVWTVEAAHHAQLSPGYYVTLSDLVPDLANRVYGNAQPQPAAQQQQYAQPQQPQQQYGAPAMNGTMAPVRYAPEPVPLTGPLHVQAPPMGADQTLMVNRQFEQPMAPQAVAPQPMSALPPTAAEPTTSGLKVTAEAADGGLRVELSLVVPGLGSQPVEVFVPFPAEMQPIPIQQGAIDPTYAPPAGVPAVPMGLEAPALPNPSNEEEWREPSHFGH